MSQLEADVRTLLTRLIFGEAIAVRGADADLLAAWSFKTLVNATFDVHRRASRLVTMNARDHMRNHLAPPPDVSLAAYHVQGLDTKVRTRVKDVSVRAPGGRLRDTALVATALIGRVAIQLVMHRSGGTPRPTFPTAVEAAAMTLWPKGSRDEGFTWPPAVAVVGEQGFEQLADPDDDVVQAWVV